MLENVFCRKPLPTAVDIHLISQILGNSWPTKRIQNWFKHRRTADSISKYTKHTFKPEDKLLWETLCSISPSFDSLHLPSLIAQSKARIASYLASQHTFWVDNNFTVDTWPQNLQALNNLRHAYNNEADNPDEDTLLSQLFEVELHALPSLIQVETNKQMQQGKV